MGGRYVGGIERLRDRVLSRDADWPEMARRGLFAFVRTVCFFFRWAWLRMRGKTAYRFSPAYETKVLPDLTIEQANGWHVPYAWKKPETCDWRAALLEQIEKLEKT